MVRTELGTGILGLSVPGSNGNKRAVRSPKSFRTGAYPSDEILFVGWLGFTAYQPL